MEMSLKLDDVIGDLLMVVRENWVRLGCGRGRIYCFEYVSIFFGLLIVDRLLVILGFVFWVKMGRNLCVLLMVMLLDLLLLLVFIEIDGICYCGEWLGSWREE